MKYNSSTDPFNVFVQIVLYKNSEMKQYEVLFSFVDTVILIIKFITKGRFLHHRSQNEDTLLKEMNMPESV